MDYFYTVSELLYFSNLKLNFLLCLDIVYRVFCGDSVTFCRAILILLPSLGSEMIRNMFFCPECQTRALMVVCDALPILKIT